MSAARPLTRRQGQVLAIIRAEQAAGRPFPSLAAIADEIGWRGDACARDALQALFALGHLTRRLVRGRWVYGIRSAASSPAAPPARLDEPHALAAAILGDDLDAGGFERGADLRDEIR